MRPARPAPGPLAERTIFGCLCMDIDVLRLAARNMILYYAWCDGRPMENVLYFIDLTPGSLDHALTDLLRTTVMAERILPVRWPAGVLADALHKFHPELLSIYPSTVRAVAAALRRRGETYDGLRLLHVTS